VKENATVQNCLTFT